MKMVGRALIATLILVGASPTTASGRVDPTDTDLQLTITAASGRLKPGLCTAGDTPLCVGSYQTQFHFWITECVANGIFEGRALPMSTRCGLELGGFMVPPLGGLTKPNCQTAHTYTSDEATAFGPPVNEVWIDGITGAGRGKKTPSGRRLSVSYPAGAFVSRTAFGWTDDDDRDTDPVGDHSTVLSIQARAAPPPGQVPCVNVPFTDAVFTAIMLIS